MTDPEDRFEPPEADMDSDGAWVARHSHLLAVGRLVLVSGMITAILGGCMFFDEVDRCLDGGGRWNDATHACELDAPRGDEASVRGDSTATLFVAR